MRAALTGLVFALALSGARAEDRPADPCAFNWPLAREQAWLSAADLPGLASGASLPAERPAAVLTLKPSESADLPSPPSRAAKAGTFAGYLRVPAPSAAGLIQVTVSGEGWIDVGEEGGAWLKPVAISGKPRCAGLRKSLRYAVGAKPLLIEVSDAGSESIRLAVAPAE